MTALAIWQRSFMDFAFFPAFSIMLGGSLISLSLASREEGAQLRRAELAASRLRLEVVRKQLQPHFLKNALTSALEWVETDPAKGARALDAISGELSELTAVADERVIRMDRELALCRRHLESMSFRRDLDFVLETQGVDPQAAIAPAVLHTLVENVTTHNRYREGPITLRLSEERAEGERRLTLRAPLAAPQQAATGCAAPAEGGGLAYVRARLAETFRGAASVRSVREGDDWVTTIALNKGWERQQPCVS